MMHVYVNINESFELSLLKYIILANEMFILRLIDIVKICLAKKGTKLVGEQTPENILFALKFCITNPSNLWMMLLQHF